VFLSAAAERSTPVLASVLEGLSRMQAAVIIHGEAVIADTLAGRWVELGRIPVVGAAFV
jgi:hypothetical protein